MVKSVKKTDYSIPSQDIAEAYLAAIVHSSYDGIISKNLDGIITSWNGAAEEIFGYTAEEVIGKHISLIIPEDRLHEETHIIAALRSGQIIEHFETVRRRKDGSQIDLLISVSPIRDKDGVVIGASKVARDITEKKNLERSLQQHNELLEQRVKDRTHALEQQSAFLKAVLESVSDSIVACDENGVLNLFNHATKELHGLPQEPLPPEKWAEHYQLFNADGKTPMAMKEVPLYRALNEGAIDNVEMVVHAPAKEPKHVLASGRALVDPSGKKFGAVVSMHDITEQKRQEAALIESELFLRTIIDTVADPIFVKDGNHCWIEGNTALWSLLGPEENIRGKSDHEIFPKEQADRFRDSDKKVFEGGKVFDAEEVLRGIDGKEIIVSMRKMPFSLADGGNALVGIMRNITKERQLEDELRRHKDNLQELVHIQTKDLVKAKDQAEQSNKQKSDFLANISHEIRTPMNAIIGIARILEGQDVEPSKQKDLLRTLSVSTHQLMTLVNDLLDTSKIQDPSFSLQNVSFDLKEVIEEIVSINKYEAEKRNVHLQCVYKNRFSSLFMGDPVRLRQVVMNLVTNALKFTEKGSVFVEIDCLPVKERDRLNVKINVRDTGVGIPADKLDVIFERYIQADNSIVHNYGGTGLGLAICRHLTNIMGGSISVQSEIGRGSCFTVQLPLRVSGEPLAVADKINHLEKNIRAAGEKLRILLVEDYEPNILVTGMLLERFGYDYVSAKNGKAALSLIEENAFDLVLMDVQMPEMDGFTATRLLREKEAVEHTPRIPIIGMTAHTMKGDRERCEVSGMDDYIAKPFDSEDLKAKIASLIEKTRNSAE